MRVGACIIAGAYKKMQMFSIHVLLTIVISHSNNNNFMLIHCVPSSVPIAIPTGISLYTAYILVLVFTRKLLLMRRILSTGGS